MRRGTALLLVAGVLLTGSPAHADPSPGYQVQTAGVALRVTSTQSGEGKCTVASGVLSAMMAVDWLGTRKWLFQRAAVTLRPSMAASAVELIVEA